MLKFLPIFVWAGFLGPPYNRTMTFEATDEELSKEKIAIVLQEVFDRGKDIHVAYIEAQEGQRVFEKEVEKLKKRDRVEMADQKREVGVFTQPESKEKAYVFACKESIRVKDEARSEAKPTVRDLDAENNFVRKTGSKSVRDVEREDYVFSRKESKDLIEDNSIKGREDARILVKDEGKEVKGTGQVGVTDHMRVDRLIKKIIVRVARVKQLIVGKSLVQAKEVDEKMFVESEGERVEDFFEAPGEDCFTVGVRKNSNVCNRYQKKTTCGLHPGYFTHCAERCKKGRRLACITHVVGDHDAAKRETREVHGAAACSIVTCQSIDTCQNERSFAKLNKYEVKQIADMSGFPILLSERKRGCDKVVHDTPEKAEKRKELIEELIKERKVEKMVSKLVKEELPGRRDGARKRSNREGSAEVITSQRVEIGSMQHMDHHVFFGDWYPWVLPFTVEDYVDHRRNACKSEEEHHITKTLPRQEAPPRPPSKASQEVKTGHPYQKQDYQKFGEDSLHNHRLHKAKDPLLTNVAEASTVRAPMMVMPSFVPHHHVYAVAVEEVKPRMFDETAKEAQHTSHGVEDGYDKMKEESNENTADVENAAGRVTKTRSRRQSTGVKAKKHYRCLVFQGKKEREEGLPRSRLQLELDQEMARRAEARGEVGAIREEKKEEEDNDLQ